MANELRVVYNATGTVYAIIQKKTGTVYQTTTDSFVPYVDADVAKYKIALTKVGGDMYAATKPPSIPPTPILHVVTYYLQTGDSPSTSDVVLFSGDREFDTPSPITLDAVNQILEGLGQPPVEVLDTDGVSEEAEAERMLNRYTKRVLEERWNVNTRKRATYTPATRTITLTDVLWMTPSGPDSWRKFTILDGKLYDLDNDTNVFTADTAVTLDVVLDIPFVKLAPAIRNYIIALAKHQFQIYKKRGVVDERLMQEEIVMARVQARRHDTQEAQSNMHDSPATQDLKGHRYRYR